jgi:brefeldin A-inhibited guanine nucleotide-exchange protein
MNLLDSIQAPQIEGMPNFYNTDEARRYFTDALIVFKSICKLCLKDVPNQGGASSFGIGSLGGSSSMMNTFTMRSKILGLELILAVVERPGTTFLNSKEFVTIIKDTLCDGLLKYCVSSEKSIFSLSLSIFYCLFLHFREHLKQEIVVFLEQIFLKILDSGNSIYHHKYLILNVFDKLSQNTKHLLEIFINYDCDFQQKDILERTIDSLSKIA